MQVDGAATDVGVAEDIAGLFMTWWGRKLKQSLVEQSATVMLYCRYVDGTNILVRSNSSYCKAETGNSIKESIRHVAESGH